MPRIPCAGVCCDGLLERLFQRGRWRSLGGPAVLDATFKPAAGGPLAGAGLKTPDTPALDFAGKMRGDKPSIGALEP